MVQYKCYLFTVKLDADMKKWNAISIPHIITLPKWGKFISFLL